MATTTAAKVDTAHVSGRRKIRYASHDEVLTDVERLAASGYRQLGYWSLGQIAKHLSTRTKSRADASSAFNAAMIS